MFPALLAIAPFIVALIAAVLGALSPIFMALAALIVILILFGSFNNFLIILLLAGCSFMLFTKGVDAYLHETGGRLPIIMVGMSILGAMLIFAQVSGYMSVAGVASSTAATVDMTSILPLEQSLLASLSNEAMLVIVGIGVVLGYYVIVHKKWRRK